MTQLLTVQQFKDRYSIMEAAVALWGNTTLGLLLHWWQANKQQAGRGNIGKTALANFVCLGFKHNNVGLERAHRTPRFRDLRLSKP